MLKNAFSDGDFEVLSEKLESLGEDSIASIRDGSIGLLYSVCGSCKINV